MVNDRETVGTLHMVLGVGVSAVRLVAPTAGVAATNSRYSKAKVFGVLELNSTQQSFDARGVKVDPILFELVAIWHRKLIVLVHSEIVCPLLQSTVIFVPS